MRPIALAFRSRPSALSLWFALTLAAASAGCGGSDGSPSLEEYFRVRPYSNAACNAVDQRLAGEREMRLFVNGRVSPLSVTQGLARYYHRHGLSFFARETPQPTTMAYALDTNSVGLTAALIEAFPGVDLTDEQALMADPVLWNQIVAFIGNFVLRPMVDFAKEHGGAGTGVTNLVVIADLERPGGEQVGDPGEDLAGLAISPALLAQFAITMPEEAQIWQGVSFPPDFTPMMVLGNNVLARVRNSAPELEDLVTSHEFGHTAALIHTMVERNLMFPSVRVGRDDCLDSLDDIQLATMRASLNLQPAAGGALLRAPAAAALPPAPDRTGPLFSPAGLRAMMAGDRTALRSLVERLFHGRPRRPG